MAAKKPIQPPAPAAPESVDPYVRAARKHPRIKQQAMERLGKRIDARQAQGFKQKGG